MHDTAIPPTEIESSVVASETVQVDSVERPAMDGPTPSPLVKWTAIIAGIVGFVMFVALPFLPVKQEQTSLTWPQNDTLNSVYAPLISQAPSNLDASIPLSLVEELDEGDVLFGTLPPRTDNATNDGMQVRVTEDSFDVIVRNRVLLSLNEEQLNQNIGSNLRIYSDSENTWAEVEGATDEDGEPLRGGLTGDSRPQIVGIYTDLPADESSAAAVADGLNIHVEIDSRFTASPTFIKAAFMVVGLILMIASLWALRKIDLVNGGSLPRWLPQNAWRPRLLDYIVVGTLLVWHVIGANTSDDGYIFTMARVSEGSGYMANYYRWLGVSESPFGWPFYDLLALMVQVSTASMWMRLPALIAGIVVWFTLSRLIIPRLGKGISSRRVAYWSAAGVFLSFWLPYNNGLRPEPVIACMALLAWVFIERAIYTRRLFPAAIGVVIATLAVGSGPTGLMALAAILGGLPALIRIVVERHKALGGGWKAPVMQIAPFLAAGTAILIGVFAQQTLATVLEATRVRGAIGPNQAWYEEPIRWYWLILQSVDGSMTRRFGVMMAVLCLVITIVALLRHRTVPGALAAPTTRLVFMFVGTMFFMTFTPTKWTHHFGVYAGIAAALAALASVAISHWCVNSRRNRVLFSGVMLLVLAYTFTGINGWWYVSAYGVPWYDKTVQLNGHEANSVILLLAMLVLAAGVIFGFVDEYKGQPEPSTVAKRMRLGTLSASPIAVVTFLMVAFSVLSMLKGIQGQWPAYSIAQGNMRSLTGNSCNLADDILVEQDSNRDFLTPVNGDLGDSLNPDDNGVGFSPNGLPSDMTADAEWVDDGTTNTDTSDMEGNWATGDAAGTDGGFSGVGGVNGSRANLPFGLSRDIVPVLGTYSEDVQVPASLETEWYELPERSEEQPLLVVTAGGRIAHHDYNGVEQSGQDLLFEFGREVNGEWESLGTAEPMDIGPQPAWRNLRLPMDQVPEEATAVRLQVEDTNLTRGEWIAVTPPRAPIMEPLSETIGEDTPTLTDWAVAFQFPCQRPFDHWGGVAENPEYRIMPDRPLKISSTDTWQSAGGGGVLALSNTVNRQETLSAYQKDDWGRDWGSVEHLTLRPNRDGALPDKAGIDVEQKTRSGLWSPGKMLVDDDGAMSNTVESDSGEELEEGTDGDN